MTTHVSLDLSQELGAGPGRSPGAPPADQEGADRRRATAVHAVGRDLDRLHGVLGEPITSVRRAALVAHLAFLVDQLRQADAELANRHSVALSRLRHEARLWSRDPGRREDLRGASRIAAAALTEMLSRAADPGPEAAGPPPVRLRDLPGRRPTVLAYRYFWLLDGVPPQLAAGVTDEVTRPARWVLRNVLSGGYNRRAYLMWVGGGAGPAV